MWTDGAHEQLVPAQPGAGFHVGPGPGDVLPAAQPQPGRHAGPPPAGGLAGGLLFHDVYNILLHCAGGGCG